MHGRPRLPPGFEADAETTRKAKAKAQQLDGAVRKVLEAKARGDHNELYLNVAAGVLQKNPDVYSLWNYRREALEATLASGEAAQEAARAELELTERCLLAQPKSYGTWHQRRWVIEKGHTDLDAELRLVDKLLANDSRNFHGWNHRFFVVQRMGRSDEDELEFTHNLITQDYSNFSAWHYRSLLLPRVHAARGHLTLQELTATSAPAASTTQVAPAVSVHEGAHAGPAPSSASLPLLPLYELRSEFQLLSTALHMDPDDASAWSYHRWLLDGVMQNLVQARSYSSSSDDSREVEERSVKAQLLSELAACEGIVEAESQAGRGQAACPGTKWPIITMAHICGLLRQLLDQAYWLQTPRKSQLNRVDSTFVFRAGGSWLCVPPALNPRTEQCRLSFCTCAELMDCCPNTMTPTMQEADPEQVDLKKKQVAYYNQLQAIDMQRVNYYKDQEAALTLS